MRYINKRSQPTNNLYHANQSPPSNANAAISRWSNLQNKNRILERLLCDQYYLCCYSELRADEYGIGYHIEHVENKSQNPARTFDYSNLAASAYDSSSLSSQVLNSLGQQRKDVFGGHAFGKIGEYNPVDMSRFISPYQRNCIDYFIYQSDGFIAPNPKQSQQDRDKAKYTIDILNLNSPVLVTRREQLWHELDTLMKEHNDIEELNHWLSIELLPRRNNGRAKLESFFTLKRQFFDSPAENFLSNYKNGVLK